MLLKVAITGQPGSGKSLVTKLLGQKDEVFTLSADRLAHTVLGTNLREIRKIFNFPEETPKEIVVKALSKTAFKNDSILKKLEDFIHPKVFTLMNSQFQMYEDTLKRGDHIIAVEVPLLYEVGWEKCFDKVILVKVADYEQYARLELLRGWTEEEIGNRIKKFIPDNKKVDIVDHIIDTTCLLCDLSFQVDLLHEDLLIELGEKNESNNPR